MGTYNQIWYILVTYILFVMREKTIDNLVALATVVIKFTNNRFTFPWVEK